MALVTANRMGLFRSFERCVRGSGWEAARSALRHSMATKTSRTESDAFGRIEVSSDVLWGAQTQRSLQNFPIGGSAALMPEPVIKAFAVVKKCAAQYNMNAGRLDTSLGEAMVSRLRW